MADKFMNISNDDTQNQWSEAIRQLPINLCTYIPNDDTQSYPFWRLNLLVETFEHSSKWSNQSKCIKVVKPTDKKNKKTLL